MKRIVALVMMSFLMVQGLQFAPEVFGMSQGGGGDRSLDLASWTSYSPDQYWKCDGGEYFFDKTDQTHKCKTDISATSFFTNYRLQQAVTDFGSQGTNLISSPTFISTAIGRQEGVSVNMPDPHSFFPRRGKWSSVEVLGGDGSRLYDNRFAFYDIIHHDQDAEYLLLIAGDDDYSVLIDGELYVDAYAVSLDITSFTKTWLYPMQLSGGSHVLEFQYDDSRGMIGGVVGELVGPFPKGSLYHLDGTQKSSQEILDFIYADGVEDVALTGTSLSLNTPRKWEQNVLFNMRQYHSNSISSKKNQLISYAPNRPGYFCPDGKKVFFKKDVHGVYESFPYCYAGVEPAKPNPQVTIVPDETVISGGNVANYQLRGACREGLGEVAITISGTAFSQIPCTQNERSLTTDFGLLPEGELLVSAVQSTGMVLNGNMETFSSPIVTTTLIKDTLSPRVDFEPYPLICEYRKALTGVISDETSSADFLGFSIIDEGDSCDQATSRHTSSPNADLSFALSRKDAKMQLNFDFMHKAFNHKKLCIKSRDAHENVSISSSSAINGIATCDPSIAQLDPVISRKEKALDLGEARASYTGNISLTFQGDISHDADQVGLNITAPAKGDYVLTYTARDVHGKIGKAQRVIHIVDADPLQEQIQIGNTPATIRNKVQSTIDYMFKVKDEVQKVFDNPKSTQSEIDQATEYLKDAIAKLRNKRKPENTVPLVFEPLPEPEHLAPEPEKEEKTEFGSGEIFNPSIENGQCYTRREYLGIQDSDRIRTSEEFKKALSFLWTYEMTMFDEVESFAPYRNLSRQEAAKIFSNFAINVLCRKPDLTLKTDYLDTQNADPTLKPYIELAYQLGVMKGGKNGKGNFRPFEKISKAEVNATLIRMILKSYLDESKIDGKKRYTEYNKVATQLGIITKDAGVGEVSRNDVALMLFRAYKNQVFDWRELDYFSYVLDVRDQFVK